MVFVNGKGGASVKVIADSIFHGVRLMTLELQYARFIHSELMTHRMLSKNSASSRAIPVKTMIELVKSTPAMPVYWGKNQAGMQAKEELTGDDLDRAQLLWKRGASEAIQVAEAMNAVGLHKQTSNRGLETYQMMKSVVSGTEWANLIHLRNHTDAQPEFHELARCIVEAMTLSQPVVLKSGQWHLPYVDTSFDNEENVIYSAAGEVIDQETAIMVSASCCAQVSYRRLDESIEKAKDIYKRLIESEPAHSSPFEHQATPMSNITLANPLQTWNWENGVTHVRKDLSLWSGNFRSWIQHRQLIPNNTKWG